MANPTDEGPNANPINGVNPFGGIYGNASNILGANGITGPAASITGQSIAGNGGAAALQSQQQLMQALGMQAAGTAGPTVAQNTLQTGLSGNLSATLAAAAAQRGNTNPGIANKQLQENQVGANAQGAGQAAGLSAGIMQNAQGAEAGVQGQAISTAEAQAGLNQQASLANQAAQQQYLQQIYGITAGNTQAANQWLNPSLIMGGMSGAGQGMSSMGAMGALASDEQVKQNLANANAETEQFIAALSAANNQSVAQSSAHAKVADKDVPAQIPQQTSSSQSQPSSPQQNPQQNALPQTTNPVPVSVQPAPSPPSLAAPPPSVPVLSVPGAAPTTGTAEGAAPTTGMAEGGKSKGQIVRVGEKGPETAYLPPGAVVLPDHPSDPRRQAALLQEFHKQAGNAVNFKEGDAQPMDLGNFDVVGQAPPPENTSIYQGLNRSPDNPFSRQWNGLDPAFGYQRVGQAAGPGPENGSSFRDILTNADNARLGLNPEGPDLNEGTDQDYTQQGGMMSFPEQRMDYVPDIHHTGYNLPVDPNTGQGYTSAAPLPDWKSRLPPITNLHQVYGRDVLSPDQAQSNIDKTYVGMNQVDVPLHPGEPEISTGQPEMWPAGLQMPEPLNTRPTLQSAPVPPPVGGAQQLRAPVSGMSTDVNPLPPPVMPDLNGNVDYNTDEGPIRTGQPTTDLPGMAEGGEVLSEFMKPLKNKSYDYKDPTMDGARPGKNIGIMAQQLQKSEIGKTLVNKGEDGVLRVDPARLAMSLAGAVGALHTRLEKLEKKKKV